jgi:hypothetical protein
MGRIKLPKSGIDKYMTEITKRSGLGESVKLDDAMRAWKKI